MQIIIYKVQNVVNGKLYVGQTNDFDRRCYEHTYPSSGCTALKSAVAKYGKDRFVFEILETCSPEKADEREAYWVSQPLKGRAISEEHRQRIAQARKGRKHSEETRRKMSLAQKKRWALERTQ